jgi:hypothetical protein
LCRVRRVCADRPVRRRYNRQIRRHRLIEGAQRRGQRLSLKLPVLPKRKTAANIAWGSKGKDARLLAKFCRLFSRMEEANLRTVLFIAQKMAKRKAV